MYQTYPDQLTVSLPLPFTKMFSHPSPGTISYVPLRDSTLPPALSVNRITNIISLQSYHACVEPTNKSHLNPYSRFPVKIEPLTKDLNQRSSYNIYPSKRILITTYQKTLLNMYRTNKNCYRNNRARSSGVLFGIWFVHNF